MSVMIVRLIYAHFSGLRCMMDSQSDISSNPFAALFPSLDLAKEYSQTQSTSGENLTDLFIASSLGCCNRVTATPYGGSVIYEQYRP